MNREDAKDTKEDPQGGKEEYAVLPSRSLRLRGLIIPMLPDVPFQSPFIKLCLQIINSGCFLR
ncbi:MAG: hypothetical protein QQW96_09650 [Tychonema bourrellyi B0820]|nr:hypothetical protein [Tychonema bourrellyi B0820]